ncbi:MAG: flagellar filament protein FlaA [Spirochaetaceae bacterium]|nr:flagellar filament protein FlaA [Spirochaetaceae bacterium]
MKQGRLSVCLVLISLVFLLPMFAQVATTTSYDSIMIDNFDQVENVDWVWYVQGSRYIAEGYPRMQYFEGAPNSVKYLQKDGVVGKVLGVEAAFNRKGDNWLEIYPAKKDANGKYQQFNLDLKGDVDHIDVWVWGAGYPYNLDLLLRDADGRVHSLPMTKLSYIGWKNIKTYIPGWLIQRSRYRAGAKTLRFVGFRIRTEPYAPVDIFTVYFDQLKYLSNTFADIYDGYDFDTKVFDEKGAGL